MLLLRLVLDDFNPLDPFFLDFMHAIYLGKQCVVHTGIWKLLSELFGSLLQRHTSLQLEGLFIHNPLDMMRLEKFEPKTLPTFIFLVWNEAFIRWFELLEQR